MTDLVGQTLGDYRLTRLLGRGGSAEVYLGEHVSGLRTPVAIKVLSERYTDAELQHFSTEVSTIARLVHPLIVRVLDYGVEGRLPFLVMDYASNGTLRDRHPAGALVPLTIILRYVQQVAEALWYAHEAKVIHRDIKPENLLIGRHQHVLLSDFGIAIRAHTPASQTPQWVTGTATYMAPEQCRGNASKASDQYSLAVVVYEWLSGGPPFPGKNPFSVVVQHLETPPPPLRARVPSLSPVVEQVVMKALAKDPEGRFRSVQAFAAALEAANRAATPQGASLGPTRSWAPPVRQDTSAALPSATPLPLPAARPADLPGPDRSRPDSLLPDRSALFSPLPSPSPDQLTPPSPPSDPRPGPARQRREPALQAKDSFRYFIGGGVMMLVGLVALLLSNGHPTATIWIVSGCAIGLGGVICLGAFLTQ